MKNDVKYFYTPILNFAVHALVGTVIFLIIGFPAVVLGLVVHNLDGISGVSKFTISTLTFLEHALLVVDSVAVVAYVTISTYREIKEMINHG